MSRFIEFKNFRIMEACSVDKNDMYVQRFCWPSTHVDTLLYGGGRSIKSGDYYISVVRNKKGEVFYIGQKVITPTSEGVIKGFKLVDDELLCVDTGAGAMYSINLVVNKESEPKNLTDSEPVYKIEPMKRSLFEEAYSVILNICSQSRQISAKKFAPEHPKNDIKSEKLLSYNDVEYFISNIWENPSKLREELLDYIKKLHNQKN